MVINDETELKSLNEMFLFILAVFFTHESLQAAIQNQHLKGLLFSTAGTFIIVFISLQVSHQGSVFKM